MINPKLNEEKISPFVIEGVAMKPDLKETLLSIQVGETRDIEKWRISESATRVTANVLSRLGKGRWKITSLSGDRLLHIKRTE